MLLQGRVGTASVAVGVITMLCACTSTERTPTLPIQRADAEALLSRAVALAQAGDFNELCKTVAASVNNCEVQNEDALRAHQQPGPYPPQVTSSDYYETKGHPTMVLHVEGKRADGSSYSNDFAVINIEGNRLGSLTSVYWGEIRFSPDIVS